MEQPQSRPKINSVHSVNDVLVALVEISPCFAQGASVISVPGGGRILFDTSEVLARVGLLLGASSQAKNPYEQRRRKEFLRRAGRTLLARQSV